MVEIPDRLRCLFAARVDERDGSYVIEVPREEIERETVAPEETYRVVVLPNGTASDDGASGESTRRQRERSGFDAGDRDTGSRENRSAQDRPTPPVETGAVREVTIEAVGDQGDGIAKVERGYVVIVPDAEPGEQVRVEIEQVRPNVSFARVINEDEGTATETTTGDADKGDGPTADEQSNAATEAPDPNPLSAGPADEDASGPGSTVEISDEDDSAPGDAEPDGDSDSGSTGADG
jgi:predicted RNA-binding protein with TRAM domain